MGNILDELRKEKMMEYIQDHYAEQRDQWVEMNRNELEKEFLEDFSDEFNDFCNDAYNRENE